MKRRTKPHKRPLIDLTPALQRNSFALSIMMVVQDYADLEGTEEDKIATVTEVIQELSKYWLTLSGRIAKEPVR